ncbi:MAG: S-layer homology domain-containing protein [Peptoanaerobacter stomatis]|uniref:S-layer homology domain-containing protein n=1 Tax=Peptoanaerobacter stomatis TaxID=796937 RepID=UPI003FA0A6ED
MLRKKVLAFAVAFALVLPICSVPTNSYAYRDVTQSEHSNQVAEIEDIADITDEFVNKYKDRAELYLSAPDKKEIKNIGKLKDFKNLTTLSIKSYNIEETALKNLIKDLPKLSKIIIDTNKFIDLGGISNEIRQYGGSQKIETIIQYVNLEDVFTKNTIDNPIKINGKPVAINTTITANGYNIPDVIDNSEPSKIKIKNFNKLVENGLVEIELSYDKTVYKQINTKQFKDIKFEGNIRLKIDKPGLAINVVDGTSNKIEAKSGEKVELKAEKTKDGKKFDKWVSDDVVITNSNSRTEASFTMPNKAVTVKATYKDYEKINNLEATTGTILMTTITTDVELKVTPEENSDELTWTSSRESVATVDNTGRVTAKAKGETVITAKSLLNVTTSVSLKVITEGLPDATIEEPKPQKPEKPQEPQKSEESQKQQEPEKKSNSNDKAKSNSNSSTSGGGGGGGGSSSAPKPVQKPVEAQTETATQEKAQTNQSQQEISKEIKVSDVMTTKEAETKVNNLNDINEITWSKQAIVKVMQKGIMSGDTSGKFMPKKSVTRAEVAQVIANIIGKKSQSAKAVKDVDSDKWYANAVQTVLENKIFTQDEKGNFRPQSKITRAELFVVIARFKGIEPLEDAKAKEVLANYKDIESIPNWALGYVSALVDKGIVNGSDNKISANDNLTREQLAKIFSNIVE